MSTTTEKYVKPIVLQKTPRVLVTGGAGYIGSHTTLALLECGYKVVIIDNLCNSYKESVKRVRQLAMAKQGDVKFVKGSVEDKTKLHKVFKKYNIVSVIHFAGLKSVSESIQQPLSYYHNNLTATCSLLEVMKAHGVKNIVFSSSATVYGNAKDPYIKETAPTGPLTPYGRSKLMCEEVIRDVCKSDNRISGIVLRYFNPVGCHASGLIGENPRNAPNNLMPCVTLAMTTGTPMKLFGDKYDTHDGSAIRDFIHVTDLAEGHVAALRKLEYEHGGYFDIFNMGNGVGSSVKQVITTMEAVTGVDVPHQIVGPRAGDAVCVVADPTKAFKQLCWEPRKKLDEMCSSSWNYKYNNPLGYEMASKKSMTKKIKSSLVSTMQMLKV